jgi:DNA polymerase epsilon subunit 1
VNIREFSEQAKFSDPAMTYILPNVFCSFCTAVRNLDLLRDPELRGKKWNCTMCHSSLNKSAIEARLVEIVQRRSAHYQTQDLVCRKCEQVKADYLATICTNCSSSFRTKEGSEEVFNEFVDPPVLSIAIHPY